MSNRAGELVTGLRRGTAAARLSAARALARYARTELRETPPDQLAALLDELNHHIFDMVSSGDAADKTAGVLAIVCLIGADSDTTKIPTTRLASYLRNVFPSSDVPLMELAAKTMGRLASISDLKRAEYVEFEVRRALEWLSEERHEGKRHAAILILRELAIAMPTYFYQQMSGFIHHILIAFKDPKAHIREAAGTALRAGLTVTAQRENVKHTLSQQWYRQCYEEAIVCLDDTPPVRDRGVSRDDRIHGGLIILNELLRCSNVLWERKYTELMQNLDTQQELSLTEEIIGMQLQRNPLADRRAYYNLYAPSNTQTGMVTSYESGSCRQLLMAQYDKICADVTKQMLCRTSCVQQILLIMIPRLAAFNKDTFVRNHLNSTMNHILPTLRRKDKDKNMAFTSLGLLAAAMENSIENYISRIIDVIRLALPTRDTPSKRKPGSEPAVFMCISLLCYAVKEKLSKDIKELLEPMFATGLTPALTVSLNEISRNTPSLKKDVSELLLNMLSHVLRNKTFGPIDSRKLLHQISSLSISDSIYESTTIVLAMKTLRSFDFVKQYSLLCFVRRCIDHFIDSEQQEIRLEAVRTSTKLLSDAVHKAVNSPSKTLDYLLDEVVGKLLLVAIVDPDNEVRYCVLESLNETFNMQLAQVNNLRMLFIATNDEQFEIRLLAISAIGRLSTVNPAYVMPGLRKALIEHLTEIEHSGMCRTKERAAKMLDGLILNGPRVVRPYMETILNVLVPKLKLPDSNPGVIVSILKVIGDLADINGDSTGFDKWMPELMTTLIEFIADTNTSEKKSVALWTFGQVIGSTGRAVQLYYDYPNLLDILLNFLKTEQLSRDRHESIRVLGLLGALDPYKHKIHRGLIDSQPDSCLLPVANEQDENPMDVTTSELLVNMSTTTLEEYYPAIVTSTLMVILRDPTLAQHHTTVVQAITFIFQSLGTKCVPYIPQVVPGFLQVIRTSDSNFRDFLFIQLAKLISIVKQHIRNYLDLIIELIKESWSLNSPLEGTIILLVEHIAVALGSEFKAYLPSLMPHILKVLWHDTSKDRAATEKLLRTLQKFGDNLDDYLHLVLPPIVKLFEATDCPVTVPKAAMETVCRLGDSLYYNDLILSIIHPLVRVLDTSTALRMTAMDTICALILQLGRKYTIFIPLVQKVMAKHKIHCQNYEVLISKLQSCSTLASDDFLQDTRRVKHFSNNVETHLSSDTSTIRKLFVSAHNLRAAWSACSRVSRDDWLDWQRQLSIGLLGESHSPAVRACVALAHSYPQVLRDLFNAAFLSCWTELDDAARGELARALEQALMVPDAPELANTVLNLAEFMDHCDQGPLPISSHLLGEQAMKCRAYAKALRYKEEEFRKGATSQVVEALFHINNKLQQKEAAEGLLGRVMSSQDPCLQVQVRWYEKLHNWNQALQLYSEKLESEPMESDARLGQMRCLEALGDWGKLQDTATEWWPKMSSMEKNDSARLAAVAAWGLSQWDSMKKYILVLPENSQDGAFFRAVIAVQGGQWDESRHYVDLARSLLDSELTAVAGESYQRAYSALVTAQLLAELEEVVTYKLVSERRETLRHAWWVRLQGGQRSVEDWRKILQVRSLVLSPQEDEATWLKFAAMCRKSGYSQNAHSTLVTLLGSDPSDALDQPLPTQEPLLILEYTKNLWVAGQQQLAYDQLERFVLNTESGDIDRCRLLARCHLKLGAWRETLKGVNEVSIPQILNSFSAATELAPDWYKAWHAWAYMNFETVLFYKSRNSNVDSSLETNIDRKNTRLDYVPQHTVPAVEGFFKSINLSHGNSLQDTLRLLTLWFDYGHYPEVHEAIVEGIRNLEIEVWLQVIPQLIARIDIPRPLVGKQIQSLLIDIGKSHPQALVYPLTLASKSLLVARKNAANHVLRSMCAHSEILVAQAAMVSDELIRVAILWHEQWHKMLDEASRLYFGEDDFNGMLETLAPLHDQLERGPQTLQEVCFHQAYSRDLAEAYRLCLRYKDSNDPRDLNQAWDLYYHVFRRINKQLGQPASLELQYVSPRLLACRGLELAVPGSYVPGRELVRIAHIQSTLQVISSKQRPRRLGIRGSDGKDYMFLLKGHEDLRQDERVMQLFGLVNTLLQGDPDTFRRNLAIQRYAVIPLSTNSGLIGWVPHCDTLYTLIRDYRLKKRLVENLEHNLIKRMAPFYEKLSIMQKVEVFEQALQLTRGDDLARLLWLKSASSEVWLERRTNFTCSLAVMSMVGYILGLGDRHPSNLMLQRGSGKLLHIDFGDCFEVAAARDKFPERVPFRLTRMLTNAMEVTGIEGTYRRTCESTMSVLHRHKDSVMAVLEAFVYDPLLNWRLMDTGRPSPADPSLCSSEGSSSPLPSRSRHAPHSEAAAPAEALNARALAIVTRVRDKLTGRDFPAVDPTVTVQRQVELLIRQATSNENLCQCFLGWCPFW